MSALLLRAYVVVVHRMGDARRGATAIEYGLLVALIVIVAMGAMQAFGTNNSALYEKLADLAAAIGG
jgi:Flp pilus assembly pilin Flp